MIVLACFKTNAALQGSKLSIITQLTNVETLKRVSASIQGNKFVMKLGNKQMRVHIYTA